MRVSVLYESKTGQTERLAEIIGVTLIREGADVTVSRIDQPDYAALAKADLVVVGTWVDGLILLGHKPGGAPKVSNMPVIDGKLAATFMSYAVNPGTALSRLTELVEERGGDVVARRAMRRGTFEVEGPAFARLLLSKLPVS